MAKKFPLRPSHPERNCWGCDRYCPANSLMCGNGSERAQHPVELFGVDWYEQGGNGPPGATPPPEAPALVQKKSGGSSGG